MRTLSFLTLVIAAASVNAQQLQNPNFEEWAITGTTWDNQPIYSADGWNGAMQTTDSYTGSYAAMIVPYMSCGISPGWMVYGGLQTIFEPWMPGSFNGSGAPIDYKPASVSGYYKFLSPNDSTDTAQGIVVLKKFNAATQQSEEVGRGELTFTSTQEYTAFTIPVTDLQPGIQPDSIVVAFSSGIGYSWDSQTDSISFGTLFVDQLRMHAEGTAAIAEEMQVICLFFPNPSAGTIHFTFSSPTDDEFTVELADLTGKIVLSRRADPGIQQTLDAGELAPGNYRAFIKGKKGIYAVENIRVGQ